jgi:hypothetical protein
MVPRVVPTLASGGLPTLPPLVPRVVPTNAPSVTPTGAPSIMPTGTPTVSPTGVPSTESPLGRQLLHQVCCLPLLFPRELLLCLPPWFQAPSQPWPPSWRQPLHLVCCPPPLHANRLQPGKAFVFGDPRNQVLAPEQNAPSGRP